ncbi:MAG TPA: GntR family transcriptional regulator, partial [Longimicrobiaceae bacterium]|nr:GntR family transcriptional regulator [Longimicrobiaceae bacterium]
SLLPARGELERLRSRAEETVLREKPQVIYLRDAVPVELEGAFPLTPRMRGVMERAEAAAGGGAIEPEHLLQGLRGEGSGSAAALLEELDAQNEAAGEGGELALELDAASDLPIWEQVVARVEEAVATGTLVPGGRLPPVRHLAERLDVAPGTVARAYAELERRGVVETRGPRGTRVADLPPRGAPDEGRSAELAEMLRPAAVAAFHRGADADELRRALEAAMEGIFPAGASGPAPGSR